MTHQRVEPTEEANRLQTQQNAKKVFFPDWSSLIREAVVCPRLSSQAEADSFMRHAYQWMHNQEAKLPMDPAVQRALDLVSAHRQVWQIALTNALSRAPEDKDLQLLQDQMVPVLREVAHVQFGKSHQCATHLVLTAEQESQALGYFRREGRSGRFVQCRATDAGSMPLFGTPQPVEATAPAASRRTLARAIAQAYQAGKRWLAELLELADTGVAEAAKGEAKEDYKYSN